MTRRLRNVKTGAVFTWTPELARHKHMRPVADDGEIEEVRVEEPRRLRPDTRGETAGKRRHAGQQQVETETDDGDPPFNVDTAGRAELVAFAREAFGMEVPTKKGTDQLRKELKRLVEQGGDAESSCAGGDAG